MNTPDPTPVLDRIEAFRHSKTMFTAVEMGVFDLLHDAPASASALAGKIAAHAGALERLLDGCAALGLLCKQDGVYSNTPAADRYLCAASPHTLAGYIRYSNDVLYAMWGNLADAIREGAPRWRQTFGIEGAIFSGFFRSEAAMRDFLRGMHGFGMLTSPAVAAAFDLSRFRRFADLGGATGHLAIAACERYPQLRAVVFDLPAVTAMTREYVAQSAVQDRVEVAPGDFFADELPAADIYAVGRILHDWSDEKVARLLASMYARLPVGGAVLIAEKLLAEDGVGPLAASMQSLNMLVVAEGRERSLSEYRGLLESAGFGQVEGRRTGTPLDAVLGVKGE